MCQIVEAHARTEQSVAQLAAAIASTTSDGSPQHNPNRNRKGSVSFLLLRVRRRPATCVVDARVVPIPSAVTKVRCGRPTPSDEMGWFARSPGLLGRHEFV